MFCAFKGLRVQGESGNAVQVKGSFQHYLASKLLEYSGGMKEGGERALTLGPQGGAGILGEPGNSSKKIQYLGSVLKQEKSSK